MRFRKFGKYQGSISTKRGSMLIWRGPQYVDSEFIRETTIYLTEAENRLHGPQKRLAQRRR